MEMLQNQLTFLFTDVVIHKYHKIADRNHLLAKGGLLTKNWNGLSLPSDVIIDSWNDPTFSMSPLQRAIYDTIFEMNQVPETVYDMVYCLGESDTCYDATFYQQMLHRSKYFCMDDEAFLTWKKTYPELVPYTAQWDFKGIKNFAFNTCNYINVTIQNYLVENKMNQILKLLNDFSPIVFESIDYNSIGANISACIGNNKKASAYLQRALQLDPFNKAMIQLQKKIT